MKKGLLLMIIISIHFGFISLDLTKSIEKKVHKEIKNAFEVENAALLEIKVSSEINSKLKTKIGEYNLFKIAKDSLLIGYAYIGKAPSKTDEFDYLVLFDTDLILKKSKLLIYREDYGAEIGSKRWLKQFNGLKSEDTIQYGNEIVAISGATISARSFTIAINNLLKSMAILEQENLFK